ncbi:hypothetical protein L6452_04795 [Arctium lappa]|uniref:Uncharacterized protein n=1 Tax=Arctium lappa TaxID=4217 RepID=A0ACB9EEQ4_ARCLA|nr:hypothetical protein L6452_04795 [Arctium lappa]
MVIRIPFLDQTHFLIHLKHACCIFAVGMNAVFCYSNRFKDFFIESFSLNIHQSQSHDSVRDSIFVDGGILSAGVQGTSTVVSIAFRREVDVGKCGYKSCQFVVGDTGCNHIETTLEEFGLLGGCYQASDD